MTTDELISYYSNLLIMQYRNKSKAVETVKAFVDETIASQIVQQVDDGFDLETAIGEQLTILGTYRNAPRLIFGLILTKQFFAMPGYDDVDPSTAKGFATYDDNPNPSWYFVLYSDVNNLIYSLSDSDLRNLIKYLAELNSSDHGLGEIDNILFKYFGTYVTLDDNLDMTITYTDDPTDPNNLFPIVNSIGALPHPSGVEVIVV